MRNLEQVVSELLSNDGTVPVAHVSPPSKGYVVGINGAGLQYSQEIPVAEVESWVRNVRTRAAQPAHYLGSWKDSETGTRYLDLVRVFGERATAEEFGREQGEIAIYDLNNDEEIRLS